MEDEPSFLWDVSSNEPPKENVFSENEICTDVEELFKGVKIFKLLMTSLIIYFFGRLVG